MKNTFKIHTITYIFALILILSGYINYLVIYIIIMFFHELGHLITIKIFNYKIKSITIYPYGGIIDTNINLNINSIHLFLISISGIMMQLLLFLIFPINNYNYEIFKTINTSLIIYNLLPIIPMDGYKIILSINENIFKYRIAILISNILSVIVLFFFFKETQNIIIFTLLYTYNITNIKNTKYIYNKFLLERYLNYKNYKKSKIIKNIKDLYKTRNNNILCDNIYTEEQKLLKKYFMSNY